MNATVRLLDHNIVAPGGAGVLQRGVSFEVSAGARLGITGPSGCGKSTLLREIAKAYGGDEKRSDIGLSAKSCDYIPQTDFLFPWYSAEDNYSALFRRRLASRRGEPTSLAEKIGIQSKLRQTQSTLSGGERQRLAFWTLISGSPNLALLDEPFTALDMKRKLECLKLLTSWAKEKKVALVLVSHDFDVLTFVCDRVIVFGEPGTQVQESFAFEERTTAEIEEYIAVREAGRYEPLLKRLAG